MRYYCINLNIMGLEELYWNGFQNYVMNRKQIVNYKSVELYVSVVTYSVPQGWVRGPFLFFSYVK